MGDIVDSDIWLSYRPASLCSLAVFADLYDNPMPESTLSPQSWTMNLATAEMMTVFVHFVKINDDHLQTLPQLVAVMFPLIKVYFCIFCLYF